MKSLKHSICIVAAFAAAATLATNAQAGTCTVDGGTYYQTINGFGFSSAWCGALSSSKGSALFSTLGMSLLRCRIDPSQSWANETANATMAHSYGAKVMGTPWTPPASYKSNGSTVGGYLSSSYYSTYASYLNTAASTIGLDYVSLANEPDITVTYESCYWTAAQFDTFLASYGGNISKPVIMPESYCFNNSMSDTALNDSTACSHITYVGGHIYGAGNYAHTNALSHSKPVWMTEHYVSGSDIANSCTIAKEITDCMNNKMSAYIWWWVYESDTNVNLVTSSGSIYKKGYAIGQFAKYVTTGKSRIAATYNPSSNVYVTAYRGNGLVIVAVNTGSSSVSQTFSLSNISGVTTLYVNRTSSSENMASCSSATVSSSSFTYTLPAQSITTFHQF